MAETDKAKPAAAAPEWKAPETLTPETVRASADATLDAARDAIRAVAFSYQGGTLPPPPWPAHPELVQAMTRLQVIRDGADALVRKGSKVALLPGVGKSLEKESRATLAQMAELQRRAAAAPKLADFVKLVPDPRKSIFGVPLWVVGGLAFLYFTRKRGGLRALFD